MSRIVIDARELRTSSGRYIERLLFYLQRIDKMNGYFVLLKPSDIDNWKPTNPNFVSVKCGVKEFTFAEQFALMNQIKKLKPDLVHFAFAQQPIWYKGKTVTTIHDLTTLRFINPAKNPVIFKVKQRVYSYVIKKAVRKSEFVITPSEYVKDDLIKFASISPDKVVVTHEAADAISDRPEPVIELEDKKFLMYIGRPTPHKNLQRLIEAFVLLKEKHPELVLTLAGKKDFNYQLIEKMVKENNISNVVFTDFISEGQLRWMYEKCSAYVFPSLSEGFGLPGLEAMAAGAPVISSNATCLPEIYGDAAEYFNPLHVNQITQTIDKVLSDTELRNKLINLGQSQVNKYSWEKMAKETLEVYEKILG